MAVISRHNRTCCFEFPTPFPATFPSCHLLGSRHAQVERLRNEWACVHTAICELPWSWAFLRWGGYFRVRGAAGGLALNHGSERHLTSCWALMLPLDEPRTLPGNSGPVDWSKGTQAYRWAGLPLSWAGLPLSWAGFPFSGTYLRPLQKYCWAVMLIHVNLTLALESEWKLSLPWDKQQDRE